MQYVAALSFIIIVIGMMIVVNSMMTASWNIAMNVTGTLRTDYPGKARLDLASAEHIMS